MPPEPATRAVPVASWLALALALAWVAAVRVPIVLNAGAHLDSDLAVDGLTLLDAVNGRWRWHYPATPFIGTPPVLLSWPQARVWGANPVTLVSGGVVAYAGLVLAAYLMNRRAFGPEVAAWGLVPLAFASTGALWLSGRITGGHLLAAAWHAGAFALLGGCLAKGGVGRAGWLGFWCGFGLYIDTMFAATGLGIAVGSAVGWWGIRRSVRAGRASACLLAFAIAAGLGVAPRFVGHRVDPHDAYAGQLEPDWRAETLAKNARILVADCLPRLIAGHRLPGLEADPDPSKVAGSPTGPRDRGFDRLGLAVAVVALGLFARAIGALAVDRDEMPSPARRAIRWGLLASSAAVVAGFLVNRTIGGPDHYRYLVFLLVPWSSGFGIMMARWAAKARAWAWSAGLVALGFAGLMTLDTARWYARYGWIDPTGRPTRRAVEDPALAWLDAHPEVDAILGDYWDVHRLAFLTGGRVRGVAFPEYPDRFPELRRAWSGGRPRIVLIRPGPIGSKYGRLAQSQRGREVAQLAGVSIVEWP